MGSAEGPGRRLGSDQACTAQLFSLGDPPTQSHQHSAQA